MVGRDFRHFMNVPSAPKLVKKTIPGIIVSQSCGLSNHQPAGKVLPCHAAESIPGLEFWNVREHALADIWANSPAFNAFRGTAWMKEPCASCPRRDVDFGGCRCQAFALTGDAAATDPVCHLAPDHAQVAELAAVRTDAPYVYRRMRGRHQADVLDGNQALSTRSRS
jgi:radical SAM protein with 4Fe4S-binding SPASM domain